MDLLIAQPESISKDIFEKYYQIIDQQRFKFDSATEFISSLNYLERMILAIERALQDLLIEENKSLPISEKINKVTVDLLNNWLSVVLCCEDDTTYINALIYNFIPVLGTLEKVKENHPFDTIRHISKFNPILDFLKSRPMISKRIDEIIKNLNGSQDIEIDTTRFVSFLYSEYKKNTLVTTVEELNNILLLSDYNNEYFKEIVLNQFASEMFDRFLENRLNIINLFEELRDEGISEIRELISKNDFFEVIEKQFHFNELTHNILWNVVIKISDSTFNAAEIGYLIWTFSKSLESIDDINVELQEWGEGSKWFNLRIKIKSLASKVDLSNTFKNLRQSLESVYHKKPIDELKKLEAEKDKLVSESNKLTKEEKNLMTSEQADLKNQLSIHKDLLDIESKEIEIESHKADIRLKNLEYLKGLSNLMKDGIIQNNSDIQIVINEILFFKKENLKITLGDNELLDINERSELKND